MVSSVGSLYSAVLSGYMAKLQSPVSVTIPDVRTARDDETQFFNDYVEISYETFIKSTPSFGTIIEPLELDDSEPIEIPSDEEKEDELREKAEEKKAKEKQEKETALSDDEKQQLQELKARDREVRAHEQAHVAAGGVYTGAASLTFQKGPDGRNYAVGGDVSINASPVQGNPEATIDKMRVIKRAALAPVNPSLQDRRVAQLATLAEQQARDELVRESQAVKDDELKAENPNKINKDPLAIPSNEEKNPLSTSIDESPLTVVKADSLVDNALNLGSIIDTKA